MKKVSIVIVVLIALVVLGYWLADVVSKPNFAEDPVSNPITFESDEATELVDSETRDDDTVEGDALKHLTPSELEKLRGFHQAALEANQNVVFYGQCIDQDRNPIPDVRVTAKLTRIRKSLSEAVANDNFNFEVSLNAKTDENGRFEFMGEGSYLLLENIERKGYLEARGPKRGYQFGQLLYGNTMAGMHKADPMHPVIFTLWKIKGASDTISPKPMGGHRSMVNLSRDDIGRSHYFDFIAAHEVSNQSQRTLQVVAENSGDSHWDAETQKVVKSSRFYSWSYTLAVPNGGIIKTDDLFMFRPPGDGYESSYTFTMSNDPIDWTPIVLEQKFYFKTSDGNYGAIILDVRSRPQGQVTLYFKNIYYNPSGKRDLQYLGY